jgi:RNA recognition motif-containing protein
VQQALKQSRALEKHIEIPYERRLFISNFPTEHDESLILELCNCFGKVAKVHMVTENGQFTGTANVDFTSEIEAKAAYSSMLGL